MATAWQTLGPFFDRKLIRHGHDLTRSGPGRPEGQVIEVAGGCGRRAARPSPVPCSRSGRPMPPAATPIRRIAATRPLDPNFTGFGRTLTDPKGGYRFVTIKPGAVPLEGNRWQAPHILVAIFAAGLLRRLVTRLYFPDEPATESDPILATVGDPEARATLVAKADGSGCYRFDIALRGAGETAFFVD